jgi:uncharacterized protein YbcI
MEQETPTGGMPAEVTRSIGAVWKRYAATRPAVIETDISGNRVRCVLRDAVSEFELGLSSQDETDGALRDLTSYRREASAAIAKATHHRVLAFISDHDEKTDTATELFLLDRDPRPAAMGTAEWIAR